jgi:DNA-binding beta-propeller fold protein YncE
MRLIYAALYIPLLFLGLTSVAKSGLPELGPKIPVAPRPSGIAWDGSSLWVVSQGGKNVQQVDPDTGEITFSFTGGERLLDILYANNFVWIAERYNDQVLTIDPTNNQRGAISATGSPRSIAYDPDSNSIWVACYQFKLLRRYDAASGESLPGIQNGMLENPRLIAWGGRQIWVSGKQYLQRIDPETGEGDNYTLPGYPYDMLWDGTFLWVTTSLANGLVRVNKDGEMTSYNVGSRPFALAWDGEHLWVSDYTEMGLLQVNPDTGETLSSIDLGYRPHAVVWAGDRLWVADIWGDSIQYIIP